MHQDAVKGVQPIVANPTTLSWKNLLLQNTRTLLLI